MLTPGDKKWIKENFKEEFPKLFRVEFNKAFLPAFKAAFKPAFDEAFDESFGKVYLLLRNDIAQLKDDILVTVRSDIAQFKDDILTELHPLQEDHTVLSYHSSEHSDQLENHDHRITALEHRNPHSPAIAVAEKGQHYVSKTGAPENRGVV
ncbi:MAG: hypothetical protein A2840_02555 [Candidatus Buchananbacteria bacterium RIFCSPHIGHO2_01_FULL_47_11b]|uniref:Uncharacterized protein n=1 Tax=Candidatus Buchananbacteria bacterium RIFCSPHIGHO2_01_FULL_47_11b TaxID=1797537 RepID=A0A1G1Y1J4_9BACT|nr:MAG: hypothetical protein A2840_02555 [Candidatus Buchananbacteria bacterium RIFCSPHIGHO2_01_FULL_47_11b]